MSEANSTVVYKDVPGFPGYRAGSDGSVWSRWKLVALGRPNGFMSILGYTWVKLRPQVGRKGYLLLTLRRNRKSYGRWVHRIILEAFVGPRPPKHEACHFPDRNPANNAISNLAWGTRKQNELDKAIHRNGPIPRR